MSVTVANRGYDTLGVVALHPQPTLIDEVEAGVKWPQPATDLRVGDRVTLIPNHVCTAFAGCQTVHYVRDGEIIDTHRTLSR